MKLFKNVFLLFGILVLVFGLFVSNVNAADNITIANAKINSANTVLVTFNDPGSNLTSVDGTKWHIDVGDGGGSPLTPTSAAITSAGAPWTVTLTFAGTPFSNTATSYSAAEGLYAEADAVTDADTDTNTVVGHAASIAIADGQAPTVLSVVPANSAINVNRTADIVITFSESMATGSLAFSTSPVAVFTPVWSTTTYANDTVTLSHAAQFNSYTDYTATIAVGTTDAATAPNAIAQYQWTFRTKSTNTIPSTPIIIYGTTTETTTTTTTTPEVTITVTATPVVTTDAAPGCSGGNLFNTSTGQPCVNNTVITAPKAYAHAYAFGNVTLKNGSKGEAVKELQRFLNDKLSLGLVVDGKLGPKTIAVIKKWQKANGLVDDGLVGAKTKLKMNAQ